MTPRCDLHHLKECGSECRSGCQGAIHLGTFVKPRPARCVPPVKLQIAVAAYVAAMSFIGFITFTEHMAERARAEQEITFHD